MAKVNKTRNKRSYGELPTNRMKRNMFKWAKSFVATGQMGRLIPFYHTETLPGDTWHLRAEIMLRFLPLYFPIMHQLELSMHWFFVPRRVTNPDFPDFINPSTPDVEWSHNRLDLGGTYNGLSTDILNDDSVYCYMGLPLTGSTIQEVRGVDAHPVAAYAKIFDDYYRFKPIQDEIFQELQPGNNSWVGDIGFERPLWSAWNHDYFTSALPEAQAGEDVLIPLLRDDNSTSANTEYIRSLWQQYSGGGTPAAGNANFDGTSLRIRDGGANELEFSLDRSDFNDSAATMQEFRLAARLLEYLEASNRHGENYRDMLIQRHNIDPTPGVVDEPVYIGGTKGQVMISDVMSTAQTLEDDNSVSNVVGDYTGQALALQSSNGFNYFCKEWGDIVGIMRVRPRSSYYQGMHRKWNRSTPMDYAQKEFAHLGDQPIYNREVYWDHTGTNTNEEVFAYTPRFEDYRGDFDTVAGKMRSEYEFIHFARKFGSTPSFNEDFIQCKPNTARIFNGISEGSTEHEMFINVLNDNYVSRALPRFGIPSL